MEASNSVPGYDKAFGKLSGLEEELYWKNGWFLSAQQSAEVAELKQQVAFARAEFDELEARREDLRRSAFNVVGLWSEFGINEARSIFWDCLERGKGFAKRSTFWDMLFGLTMGRDESMAAFVVRLALNFLVNVTFGLIGTVLAFLWYLWGMVVTYKAGLLSGAAFFAVMAAAGVSMAALYIFVIYGAVAGTGYVAVRSAVNQARLERGQRGFNRPQQIGGRPHFE